MLTDKIRKYILPNIVRRLGLSEVGDGIPSSGGGRVW